MFTVREEKRVFAFSIPKVHDKKNNEQIQERNKAVNSQKYSQVIKTISRNLNNFWNFTTNL